MRKGIMTVLCVVSVLVVLAAQGGQPATVTGWGFHRTELKAQLRRFYLELSGKVYPEVPCKWACQRDVNCRTVCQGMRRGRRRCQLSDKSWSSLKRNLRTELLLDGHFNCFEKHR